MSLESESLLAVTGYLSPEVTVAKVERAQDVGQRLWRKARDVIMSAKDRTWRPTKWVEPERLRDKLGLPMGALEGQDLLPELLGAELLLEVQEARSSALARWPAPPGGGVLEGRRPPLAIDAGLDWLGTLSAAEDPLEWMDRLAIGAALPDDVDMVREVYPVLSDVITESMFAAIIEADTRGHDLSPGADLAARLWLGLSKSAPLVKTASEATKAPESGGNKVAEETQTQAQKAGL